MKIALITPEFHPMNAAASARVGPWVDALENHGHNVFVLSSRDTSRYGQTSHYASRFQVPSNKVSVFKRFFQEQSLSMDLARKLSQIASDMDLVVITSPPFFLATRCALVAQKNYLPYVFDVRDRYPEVLFDLGFIRAESFVGKYLLRKEQRAYSNASLVTTVTKSLLQHMQDHGHHALLVSNGYDGSLFQPSEDKKAKNLFRIVYHGRFSRLHDLEGMREISRLVSDHNEEIEFRIIGPVAKDLPKKRWGRVDFMGEQPRKKIPNLLSECDLGISLMHSLASAQVAMPAKFFEYLGVGLPTIASPAGELSDFIRRHEVGLAFDKTEPEVIANEIISLRYDQSKMRELRNNVLKTRLKCDRSISTGLLVTEMESRFTSKECN